MFAEILLEEASGKGTSIWIPVLILGWFLVMTIVGWQVSRRNVAAGAGSQDVHAAHPGDNPSEFDTH